MKSVILSTVLVCLLASGASADSPHCETEKSGPSTTKLLALGGLMGVADFFVGTTLHEGTHALVIKASGGDIKEFRPYPGYLNGHFVFGYVKGELTNRLSRNQRLAMYLAPKALDVAILGTYIALLETDNLPENKYAELALTVLAAGALVDFGKDVFQTWEGSDILKSYTLLGAETGSERLPYRLAHGALTIGAGIELGRGIYRLFKEEPERSRRRGKARGSIVVTPTTVGWAGEF